MKTRKVPTHTSRIRMGYSRTDITPPVGIYHPLWGAARHTRSTGIHRPLVADVMAFVPLGPGEPKGAPAWVRVNLDLPCLVVQQHADLVAAVASGAGVPEGTVDLTYSHTHAAGWFVPDRFEMPGGELIVPYLVDVAEKLRAVAREACGKVAPVTISYATGRCDMAANRDSWDEEMEGYVCGFNPDVAGDDTLLVARVTDADGAQVLTVVNYACHPTSLAWENTLVSPDYAGALRETVEQATGKPCTFALGTCGDLGPREGFKGDTEVADRNGRQVGFAALSTLMSLGAPGTDYTYTGPVVSGATLGTWAHEPQDEARATETMRFERREATVDLPLKAGLDADQLKADLADWLKAQAEADAAGDTVKARDCGARAERARRWIARMADLPDGPDCAFRFTVTRVGDAFWVATGGEPYSLLQRSLREQFPDLAVMVSPLAGDMPVAYLLTQDSYGKGLYQEEPSSLAKGCLEKLIDAVAEEMKGMA